MGHLSKLHGKDEAEIALLVRDDAQNEGLGSELLHRLLDVARDERLRLISADILHENRAMQHISQCSDSTWRWKIIPW